MDEKKYNVVFDTEETGIICAQRIVRMNHEREPVVQYVIVIDDDPRIKGDCFMGRRVVKLPAKCLMNSSDSELRDMVLKKIPALKWAVRHPCLYAGIFSGEQTLKYE
jgi:hypothetical protein